MKTVKMTINPRIIEHLGSDLITSASVAIVELIKIQLLRWEHFQDPRVKT